MIEIHNHSTYQQIYDNFSTEFIDSYCGYKCGGLDTQAALDKSKLRLQDYFVQEIYRKKVNIRMIMRAYKSVRDDSDLVQKAIQYYLGMK